MQNDYFGAISDPTRRFLLEEIRRSPKTVTELSGGLPISRPAVSQHLKILRDSGLVIAAKQGTRRIYAVNHGGFVALSLWMDQFWGY